MQLSYNGLTGIAIHLHFNTSKLKRARLYKDENGKRSFIKSGETESGSVSLYFSYQPVSLDLRNSPGGSTSKQKETYFKHNVYGRHRYLIPVQEQVVPIPELRFIGREGFMRITEDPGTASYHTILQLLPCLRENKDMISTRLGIYPFAIEVLNGAFFLCLSQEGLPTLRIPAQDYCPTTWLGPGGHQVVKLFTDRASRIYRFEDIGWNQLYSSLALGISPPELQESLSTRRRKIRELWDREAAELLGAESQAAAN